MEAHVGGDHGRHRTVLHRLAPVLDQRRALLARPVRVAFRGLAEGEAFHDGAQVVHVAHVVQVDRRDDQPAPGRIAQHALLAQQQQCLLHRLARHAQCFGELFLDDALAGLELALGDLRNDGVVHLLGQVRLQSQDFHGGQYRVAAFGMR